MIDKKKLPTPLEVAKERAKWELNKDANKDIFVTLPDGGVYVNSNIDTIKEHATRNKLSIVIVKESGKIVEEKNVQVIEDKPKTDYKSIFEKAKAIAQSYIDKGQIDIVDKNGEPAKEKIKDIFVTFPDNAVYLNSKSDSIDKNKLVVVQIMENGELLTGETKESKPSKPKK